MPILVTQEQGRVPVTVIQLSGKLNLGTAEEFQKQAEAEYARGARDLLVDLSQVDSLTSAGLRAFLVLHRLYEGGGDKTARARHLKLANLSPSIRNVITIAGFDRYIDIFDDRADAIAAF